MSALPGQDAPSGYLRYLPPVLWEHEQSAEPGEFTLGGALRIFERILTGVPDGVGVSGGTGVPDGVGASEGSGVPHGDHTHPPLTEQIAGLPDLFDPWHTPERFLPWLASWVALDFPALGGKQLWDEYQRRKVTAEISRIHRLRGRRTGLDTYLNLYAVGRVRPRVALDDGTRVMTLAPAPTGTGPVTALVTQGPTLGAGGQPWNEGVMRPTCVAVGPDGSLFLGDAGTPDDATAVLPSRVWRLNSAGHYETAGAPPKPVPVAATTLPLGRAVAVAVRPARDGAPETLYVADRSGKLYAVEAPYTGRSAVLVGQLAPAGTAVWPVAMCVDGNGDLLVLDRGVGPPSTAAPKVITVRTAPFSAVPTRLRTVLEPLSLLVEPDGSLVIGDGGNQRPALDAPLAGNLVRVGRAAADWTETALLPSGNPLLAPTALCPGPDGRLGYVLDVGLKPLFPPSGGAFTLKAAEPAVVHRVRLDAGTPELTPLTDPGCFVYPTGMARAEGRLVVCDHGQPDGSGQPTHLARLRPHRLDVVVHFAESRLPQDAPSRTRVRNQALGVIRALVDQHKPAHVLSVLVK
ncbi:phage tail protein [Streptomyces sp. NBC_01275]|uniref:phage tail protein n=1 Tax=Streptomyces sp. NBC_01275 TaxID=2903807 RepID=UPI00224E6745|nr:phage tail protein [Streptomyces sp. NBC_01275]MCX4759748.1 phage tail protein [Streptomyces sp. NBC_01275]